MHTSELTLLKVMCVTTGDTHISQRWGQSIVQTGKWQWCLGEAGGMQLKEQICSVTGYLNLQFQGCS